MPQICRICEQFIVISVIICKLHTVLSLSSGAPNSITLYKDKDFKGTPCEIQVEGCKAMCPGMERKASSMQGNAACVHFFREKNCQTYMGTWNATMGPYKNFQGTAGQDSIVSVGDCSQPIDPDYSISFYEHKNFRGKRCNIQMPSRGCKPMCPDLENRASSAFGTGVSCARMYKEPNCKGFLGILDLTGLAQPDFKDTNLQDSISSISDCSNSSISFYEHKSFRGKRCDIPVKGCQPMCPELVKLASSAQGDAQCANVYSEANCKGFLGTLRFSDGEPYDNFKYGELQDSISSIGECVKNNTVIFYEHRDFGGKRCEMQVKKSCQPMCPGLDKKVSSAQGFVDCVQIYAGANCTDPIGYLKFSEGSSNKDSRDFFYEDYQDAISSFQECL
ncbi:unnamed protein product [Bemisia tabaci]|uniref:Uncharacterized protein n=1 Tax=Bemisia tabaci TaxID=7038 RepID=A0A9P0A2I4_BEMTA|nr:unnamed protein product [Bemisia tabaci]